MLRLAGGFVKSFLEGVEDVVDDGAVADLDLGVDGHAGTDLRALCPADEIAGLEQDARLVGRAARHLAEASAGVADHAVVGHHPFVAGESVFGDVGDLAVARAALLEGIGVELDAAGLADADPADVLCRDVDFDFDLFAERNQGDQGFGLADRGAFLERRDLVDDGVARGAEFGVLDHARGLDLLLFEGADVAVDLDELLVDLAAPVADEGFSFGIDGLDRLLVLDDGDLLLVDGDGGLDDLDLDVQVVAETDYAGILETLHHVLDLVELAFARLELLHGDVELFERLLVASEGGLVGEEPAVVGVLAGLEGVVLEDLERVRVLGEGERLVVAGDLRLETVAVGLERQELFGDSFELGLVGCLVEGEEQVAFLHFLSGADVHLLDGGAFEGLHDDVRALGDDLAGRDDDLVDVGVGRPDDEADDEGDDDVPDDMERDRRRVGLQHDGVGLEILRGFHALDGQIGVRSSIAHLR